MRGGGGIETAEGGKAKGGNWGRETLSYFEWEGDEWRWRKAVVGKQAKAKGEDNATDKQVLHRDKHRVRMRKQKEREGRNSEWKDADGTSSRRGESPKKYCSC